MSSGAADFVADVAVACWPGFLLRLTFAVALTGLLAKVAWVVRRHAGAHPEK